MLIIFSILNRSFFALAHILDSFFTDWFGNIVNEHEKSYDENNIRDFIDAFIFEKRKEKDSTFTVKLSDFDMM